MARSLARLNPFDQLVDMGRQFFDDAITPARTMRMPATDIYTEDDRQLVIEAQLPDFEEKDVSVDLDNGVLVIHAERHEKEEDKRRKYVVRETRSNLYRRIALPEQADEERIAADFQRGVLRVVVPFKDAPSPKRIPLGQPQS